MSHLLCNATPFGERGQSEASGEGDLSVVAIRPYLDQSGLFGSEYGDSDDQQDQKQLFHLGLPWVRFES